MAATSVPLGTARVDASARPAALTPAEAAWIAAVPVALVTTLAILLLGPPLGRLVFPIPVNRFFPGIAELVHPEPTEHAAYLLALGGPLLLVAAALLARARPLRLGAAAPRVLVAASQVAVCAFLVVCLVAQHLVWFGPMYTLGAPIRRAYFTIPTNVVALLIAAAIPLALRREELRARLLACLRETRRRHLGALLVAGLFTAIWLLTAINVDSSVGHANPAVQDMLPWSMDESLAILDGRTPLVSFHPQYAQLWPYLVAAAMSVLGTSLAVYTVLMATISASALLAVFALLRRVVRSSLAALALYVPFLATSFFMERGPLDDRYGPGNLLTIFPVRYAGAYLLAWLLARHLDGAAPRRAWPLFLAAGLVAINNVEFGIPAAAATLVACAWAQPPRTPRAAARLGRDAAAGVLLAFALVALLTLARSGSLPRFGLMFQFSKLFGLSGWGMLPMPRLGFHLVLYVTFAAALAIATVRAASRERDVLLTGLLAWSGVFGLGIGAYYAGRSHPEVLINLFSAWALALVLLVVIVMRALATRPARRPALAQLAVLFGLGLAVCSIAQTPTPWGQVRRLQDATRVPLFRHSPTERFIARYTRRGEAVLLLTPLGHRTAYELGLNNVSPYASMESIPTHRELAEALRALRAAHGRRVFLWYPDTPPLALREMALAGLRPTRLDRPTETVELVGSAPRW